ncbi:hypothetical protein [Sulfobacillus thermosulfidooxidans]|uniref:hypothetical protein n=1 Tax=Sulfobacillus thermosulfidooxidans TaxID=28034 RepID=UPI0006B5E699|nr:hypothetical protein [Sulfobacillus thermosulfidooxidans]
MKKIWNHRVGKSLTISVVIAGISVVVLNLGSLLEGVHKAHSTSVPSRNVHLLSVHQFSKASTDYLSVVVPEKDFTITEHGHQGMATWIAPARWQLSSGTQVVLWGWPNQTLTTFSHYAPEILGKTTIHGPSRTIRIIFTLPPSWPDVHEVFQMKVTSPYFASLKSPPYGQLPEVPWAALLPFIALSGFGIAFYHNKKSPPI